MNLTISTTAAQNIVLVTHNPTQWSIGTVLLDKLGIENSRNSVVPLKVQLKDGSIFSEKQKILTKWKSDYEILYNS